MAGILLSETELLRSENIALRQFLDVNEQTVAEQAEALEQTIAELQRQNRILSENEQERATLLTKLNAALEEMSTPILEVGDGMLAVPIIGTVDSERAAKMMEKLLHEIVTTGAGVAILDVTGVSVIDSQTADHFVKLAQAANLVGARCIVSGIRPAIARTLVALDVALTQLQTAATLRDAIREAKRG